MLRPVALCLLSLIVACAAPPVDDDSTAPHRAGASSGPFATRFEPVVARDLACSDGIRDGSEADVDCGGTCAPCGAGAACASADDCESAACVEGRCLPSHCIDGRVDGDETSLDCGGSCGSCGDLNTCLANCGSGLCPLGECMHGTCSDGVRGVEETDVDCGGVCMPCAAGKHCKVDVDCASGRCTDGVCADAAP